MFKIFTKISLSIYRKYHCVILFTEIVHMLVNYKNAPYLKENLQAWSLHFHTWAYLIPQTLHTKR